MITSNSVRQRGFIIAFMLGAGGLRAEAPVDANKQRISELLGAQKGEQHLAAFADPGSSARDEFSINASYIGAVKKSFLGIGFGKVLYKDLGQGRFSIRSRAEIQHPEKETLYKFDLDMTFELRGNRIEIVSNESEFNEASAGYRDRVERAAPFVYLTKALPVPGAGEEPSRSFLFRGSPYIIRYEHTEGGVEATAYQGHEVVSKTFLSGRNGSGFNEVEKFRVPEQDLMISFVMKAHAE